MQSKYEWVNYYFKDQDPEYPMISGFALPKDPDGVVRDRYFIGCTFHPNCQAVKFENCKFKDCNGEEYCK